MLNIKTNPKSQSRVSISIPILLGAEAETETENVREVGRMCLKSKTCVSWSSRVELLSGMTRREKYLGRQDLKTGWNVKSLFSFFLFFLFLTFLDEDGLKREREREREREVLNELTAVNFF